MSGEEAVLTEKIGKLLEVVQNNPSVDIREARLMSSNQNIRTVVYRRSPHRFINNLYTRGDETNLYWIMCPSQAVGSTSDWYLTPEFELVRPGRIRIMSARFMAEIWGHYIFEPEKLDRLGVHALRRLLAYLEYALEPLVSTSR